MILLSGLWVLVIREIMHQLYVIGPLISEGKTMKFSGKSTNALSASKYLHTRSYSIARICSTSIRPTGGERNGHVRIMFPLKHLGEILRGQRQRYPMSGTRRERERTVPSGNQQTFLLPDRWIRFEPARLPSLKFPQPRGGIYRAIPLLNVF